MARAAEALSCPAASVKDRVRRDPALRAARDRFQVEAEAARRAEIAAALRESGGNLARAAEFLAVSVRQLRRWVRADAALRAVWAELRAA